mmetsp:Transcript_5931/g.10030  ORF Transcript_5931/g.10030 Transcript_5931/m.10030 type:complete len:758 (+) Transcript_5931:1443-3716(+)
MGDRQTVLSHRSHRVCLVISSASRPVKVFHPHEGTAALVSWEGRCCATVFGNGTSPVPRASRSRNRECATSSSCARASLSSRSAEAAARLCLRASWRAEVRMMGSTAVAVVFGLSLSTHVANATPHPVVHSHDLPVADGARSEERMHGRRADADDENAGTPAYSEEAEADRVTDLPGLNGTALDFGQFAGFIDLSGDGTEGDDVVLASRNMFYWFVESSEVPPSEAPLIIWTNGGPGCSGLLGMLSENGPFRPAAGGEYLDLDPYSWNRIANVIFVEQPVFVGFSYSEDAGDASTSDEKNAKDLVKFITRWLARFEGYETNELYLASESYGGHYLPTTSEWLLQYNHDSFHGEVTGHGKGIPVNFHGFLVGNPFTNPRESNKGVADAIWGHGLLPTPEYDQWRRECRSGESLQSDDDVDCYWMPWVLYDEFVGDNVNPYALSYPLCTDFIQRPLHMQRFRLIDKLLQRRTGIYGAYHNASSKLELLYEPCREDYLTEYLNRDDVRTALHVDHSRQWNSCSDPIFDNYTEADSELPMEDKYKWLLYTAPELYTEGMPGRRHLKLLVFSGDDDAVCGVHGTQSWILNLGLNVTNYWREWLFDDPLYGSQLGGYYTSLSGLHFATVRGAGHEVPAYKPAAAYELMRYFLSLDDTGIPAAGPLLVTEDEVCQHGWSTYHTQLVLGGVVVGGGSILLGIFIGVLVMRCRRDYQAKKLANAWSALEMDDFQMTDLDAKAGGAKVANIFDLQISQRDPHSSEMV